MRIVIDTQHETWMVQGPAGSEAITVKVSVDGHEDIGLTQILTKTEMRSHFDVLWDYMGKQIKDRWAKGHK